MDSLPQPPGQKQWGRSRSEDHKLFAAHKESPWLNSMEPKWVHGKRKVVEPDGLLTA